MTAPPKAEYKPIACSMYDVLELAAMRSKRLILTIGDSQQEVIVHDVFAKGKEEFLEGIDPVSGLSVRIRLDTIDLVFDPADNRTYAPKQC